MSFVVGADYVTFSSNYKLIHMPLAAVVTLAEPVRGGAALNPATDKLPVLVLRHEHVPKSGSGWWVGISAPLG